MKTDFSKFKNFLKILISLCCIVLIPFMLKIIYHQFRDLSRAITYTIEVDPTYKLVLHDGSFFSPHFYLDSFQYNNDTKCIKADVYDFNALSKVPREFCYFHYYDIINLK